MKAIINTARLSVVAVLFAFVLIVPQTSQASSLLDGLSLSGIGAVDLLQNGGTQAGTVTTTSALTFKTCKLSVDVKTVNYGGSITLTWEANGFSNVSVNGQSVGSGSGSMTVTNITENTIFKLTAVDGNDSCNATVNVTCIPAPVLDCKMQLIKTVDKANAVPGDELTYTIKVKNIGTGNCTGTGVKVLDTVDPNVEFLRQTLSSNITAGYHSNPVYNTSNRTLSYNADTLTPGEEATITWVGKVTAPTQCGDYSVNNQARATSLELNNFLTYEYSNTVKTDIDYDCPITVAPTCDTFVATPGTIVTGNSATLAWTTTNATQVTINNGIGDVAVDGNVSVSPLVNTTYTLTAFGANNQSVTCTAPVVVSSDPVPVCNSFTATPNSLPSTGGNVTFAWNVSGATNVTIAPTIGSVTQVGSQVLNVTASGTYVLTATDADGDTVSCSAPVTLIPVGTPFSCPNNVTFTASDTSITPNTNITLNWNVTGADSVSISGINATTFSGSQNVAPSADITYTLTAIRGSQTINCPVTIDVESDGGGGGGGSSSPRCDLDISATKIKSGEEITLKWKTSNARDLTIKDDRGNVIATTEDLSSRDKDDVLDGEIDLKPTRDTTYTLVAERGSRDRECKVSVDIENGQVLGEVRDQQPLVAGIALSQVPYTGFEAGPVLTLMFYLLLMAWALYIAYFLVVRNQTAPAAPMHMSTPGKISHGSSEGLQMMQKAEAIRPDVFTAMNVETPTNLPTAQVGYENYVAGVPVSDAKVDSVVTNLENRAHSQKALLSSDAVRYFIGATQGEVERNESLDQVISEAKRNYPLEDGWIVINEARMQSLCEICKRPVEASSTPTTLPVGSSSLAEAIAAGNIVAAYEMIGNRPMFALADAAADFDSAVRARQGGTEAISDLLKTETAKLSDEQLKNMVKALTSAIDGTYTDEASAVKMAIMKAVKEVA